MNITTVPKPQTTPRMSIRDLSVLMCAAGFTRWHMMLRPDEHTGTAHRMRDVTLPGYFNDATDMMAAGDMIDVSAQDGGATLYVTEARRSPDSVRVRVMCSVDTGEL